MSITLIFLLSYTGLKLGGFLDWKLIILLLCDLLVRVALMIIFAAVIYVGHLFVTSFVFLALLIDRLLSSLFHSCIFLLLNLAVSLAQYFFDISFLRWFFLHSDIPRIFIFFLSLLIFSDYWVVARETFHLLCLLLRIDAIFSFFGSSLDQLLLFAFSFSHFFKLFLYLQTILSCSYDTTLGYLLAILMVKDHTHRVLKIFKLLWINTLNLTVAYFTIFNTREEYIRCKIFDLQIKFLRNLALL